MRGSILEIYMGAMQPPVPEQLTSQSLPFDSEKAKIWERCRHGIAFLSIHGILSDSECRKARQRLFKTIQRGIAAEMMAKGKRPAYLI